MGTDRLLQEQIKNKGQLRTGEKNYHDLVFEHEVNDLSVKTKQFYAAYAFSMFFSPRDCAEQLSNVA